MINNKHINLRRENRIITLVLMLIIWIINFNSVFAFQFNNNDWSVPTNLSDLNSNEDDFAPVWNKFQNLLYFNSTRSGYSYFYISSLLTTQKITEPLKLISPINKAGDNQSYITFLSSDEAYLSAFRKIENKPVLNIFKTYFRKNSWTESVPEENLNSKSFSSQPTISPDGTTFIFVSNRGNKNDDLDFWMSAKLDDGNWSVPIKLDELNTPGREITPFLFTSDTLYFASDGFGGPGGFDIYYSIRVGGSWQKPRPIVALNTEFNESDFMVLPNGTALLSSDRPGGKGKLDLYMVIPNTVNIQNEKEKFDISVKTQVSSLNAQKNSKVISLPVQNFFTGNYFNKPEFEKNNPLFDFFFSIPEIIVKRLEEFPSAELYIQNSSYNSQIIKYFVNKGIDKYRINFTEKVLSDLIYFKSNDPRIFEPYNLNKNYFSIKPPVLDINLDSRNTNNIKYFTLELKAGGKIINVKIPADTLPLRFYKDISYISDLIYSVDSLVIHFTVADTTDEISDSFINLKVNHSESKNKIITDSINNKKYIDYHIGIETIEKFEETLSMQSKYLADLLEDASVNSGISIQYSELNQQPTAQKLVDYLISKLKNRTKINSEILKEKNIFKELSPYIFRIRINK
jgi:hypothetical protein